MRVPWPDARASWTLGACAAVALLGLMGGVGHAREAGTLLAWLALVAPAAGVLVGATRAALPFALLVPLVWGLVLALGARGGSGTLGALAVLAGLYGLGWALGCASRAPARDAGLALLVTLFLAGAPQGFSVMAGGAALARAHPQAAARLLDASPLVLVLDCAGIDWTHSQPDVYARAGVEWFVRRPWRGNLAGPAVLVVGCALAAVASLLRRTPRPR